MPVAVPGQRLYDRGLAVQRANRRLVGLTLSVSEGELAKLGGLDQASNKNCRVVAELQSDIQPRASSCFQLAAFQ